MTSFNKAAFNKPASNKPTLFAAPIRQLAISVLAFSTLLTGCQPSDSLSAAVKNDDSQTISQTTQTTSQTTTSNDNVSPANDDAAMASSSSQDNNCQNNAITTAFKAQQSDRQVKGCGTIIKLLPDDNEGSRHQKILIELDGVRPKQTLLLVHNIDLAPRVADVAPGTSLSFYGEYVYNDKGGLVHWTHHDPAARHQGGWIDSNGVRYQ